MKITVNLTVTVDTPTEKDATEALLSLAGTTLFSPKLEEVELVAVKLRLTPRN